MMEHKHKSNFNVILASQEKAHRMVYRMEELGLSADVDTGEELPFSSNASAAIWVGRDFPYEKAIQVILISREYYDDIRYIALSDYRLDPPDMVHREIYVGGSTASAVRLGLQAWDDDDFRSLESIKNRDDFVSLVKSKYPQKKEDSSQTR